MIDTVALMFNEGTYRIKKPANFTPSASELIGYQGASKYCVQNPTKLELRQGIYKPKLTLSRIRTGFAEYITHLRVEFSIPKLLYKNNFDEVAEDQLEEITNTLAQTLKGMGIEIPFHILQTARVSAIHFSKNIPLTDFSTPSMYLSALAKAGISQRLDLNKTDFKNEGNSLKFHANSYEIAFYDKLRDLKQAKVSEKRAVEDNNAIQFHLLDKVKLPVPFEVLRMEIRLNKPNKIKQVLEKINIEPTRMFHQLFKRDIARKVLLHYLDLMKSKYPTLLTKNYTNSADFMTDLRINNPTLKLPKAVLLFGLRKLQEEQGARGLKELAKMYHYNDRNLSRLNKQVNTLSFEEDFDVFHELREALEQFETLRLRNFV